MKLKIITCEGENYSTEAKEAELSHQVLRIEGKSLEVELIASPMVYGHSRGNNNVNILFKDLNTELSDDERKYFTEVSFIKRQRILWMFNKHLLQKYPISSGVGTILIGFIGWFLVHLYSSELNKMEIPQIQVKSGRGIDSILVTVRNLDDNSAVIIRAGLEYDEVSKIDQFIINQFETIPITGSSVLPNNYISIHEAKNKKVAVSNTIPMSFRIGGSEVDKFALIVQNIGLSHLVKYRAVVIYNDNVELHSPYYYHFFSQDGYNNFEDYTGISMINDKLSSLRNDTLSVEDEKFKSSLISEKRKIIRHSKRVISKVDNDMNSSLLVAQMKEELITIE